MAAAMATMITAAQLAVIPSTRAKALPRPPMSFGSGPPPAASARKPAPR